MVSPADDGPRSGGGGARRTCRERCTRLVRRTKELGSVLALVAASLTLLPSCVRMSLRGLDVAGPGRPDPAARLRVDDQVYRISSCLSGDRGYFLGVDLVDDGRQSVLRILIDPLGGPHLRLFEGGGERHEVLGPDQCSDLRASVRPTGWRVNHVRDVEGEVAAQCTLSDGRPLEAQVRFSHCH